jgi:hypothetical protein
MYFAYTTAAGALPAPLHPYPHCYRHLPFSSYTKRPISHTGGNVSSVRYCFCEKFFDFVWGSDVERWTRNWRMMLKCVLHKYDRLAFVLAVLIPDRQYIQVFVEFYVISSEPWKLWISSLCSLLPLRSKCCPQRPALKHPQSLFFN